MIKGQKGRRGGVGADLSTARRTPEGGSVGANLQGWRGGVGANLADGAVAWARI